MPNPTYQHGKVDRIIIIIFFFTENNIDIYTVVFNFILTFTLGANKLSHNERLSINKTVKKILSG